MYGNITGVEMVKIKGREVRRITKCEWYSVGFALRAQHPDLPAVSLSPLGNFAKADNGGFQPTTDGLKGTCEQRGAIHMSWGTFAKAVSEVGVPVTDSALKTGVQALTRESLERGTRRLVPKRQPDEMQMDYAHAKVAVLRKVKDGTVPATLDGLTRAFKAVGLGKTAAQRLLDEIGRSARA